MIKEFGNCIDDSSDGGYGRYEGAGPSNVPGRDVGDDDSDDSDDGDDEECYIPNFRQTVVIKELIVKLSECV